MRILHAVNGEDNHHGMKSGVPHVINEVNATTDDEAISKGLEANDVFTLLPDRAKPVFT